MLVIDRSDYELAQGLLKLAKETNHRILRAAALHCKNDPEGNPLSNLDYFAVQRVEVTNRISKYKSGINSRV